MWATKMAPRSAQRLTGGRPFLKTLVEHWDGIGWTVVPSPSPLPISNDLTVVKAVAANDVWAFGGGDTANTPLVEHWDGASWSVVASPALPGMVFFTGIAAVSPGDVWAVGHIWIGLYSQRMLVEHWDGTGWSVVDANTATNRQLYGVSALADGTVFAVGRTGLGAVDAPLVEQICEIRVLDAGVSPATTRGIGSGVTLAWNIDSADSQAHSVSDASGMGLFDSGLRPPGGSFTYEFPAAGSYKLIDSASGHTSTVSVGMTAQPTSGTAATAFTLTWAAASATSGFAYDVQVSRPGPTVFADLLAGTADPSATFTPDAGVGTYAFRARIRNTGNGASSGWSGAKTITVS